MNPITRLALLIATGTKGNTFFAGGSVFILYLFINIMLNKVELVIYAEQIDSWFDVVCVGMGAIFNIYVYEACAAYQTKGSNR